MIASLIVVAIAQISAADLDAASNKLRADNVLLTSLIEHASPLLDCTSKAMRASEANSTSPKTGASSPNVENFAYTEKMSVAAQKCGAQDELVFWTASVKKAFPEFSDDLAKLAAANSLSFFIFDSAMTKPR